MGKFHLDKLPKEKRIKLIAEFYDAVNCLKNRDEARLFFRDLLTPDEIAMFVRRIEVALLLNAGFTYEEIRNILGSGMDKITSVQKSLIKNGEGYKLVIKRLRKILKKRERKAERRKKEVGSPFPAFDYLKKKYPGHFLLFNLVDELNDWLDDDGKLKIEREIEFQKVKKKAAKKQRQKR